MESAVEDAVFGGELAGWLAASDKIVQLAASKKYRGDPRGV